MPRSGFSCRPLVAHANEISIGSRLAQALLCLSPSQATEWDDGLYRNSRKSDMAIGAGNLGTSA
jgi:hypothetical protein